jgi:acetylornithine deacetylase
MPAATPLDCSLVITTKEAIAELTGQQPSIEGMTYGADMRLLVNEGGIPTVLFGAGDVRNAHRPDEFVLVDDLMTVARVIALTSLRFVQGVR